ncbi:hypothetical protein [Streptomyces hirsutus]|uniref:hypothetical protein n=1 Tax=Streptomyces hirsutus TaxID=35620 RepID=UPI0036AE0032
MASRTRFASNRVGWNWAKVLAQVTGEQQPDGGGAKTLDQGAGRHSPLAAIAPTG